MNCGKRFRGLFAPLWGFQSSFLRFSLNFVTLIKSYKQVRFCISILFFEVFFELWGSLTRWLITQIKISILFFEVFFELEQRRGVDKGLTRNISILFFEVFFEFPGLVLFFHESYLFLSFAFRNIAITASYLKTCSRRCS